MSEPVDLEAAQPPRAEPPPRAALGWYPLGDRLRDALDDRLQSWRARLSTRPLVALGALAVVVGLAFGAWYVLRPPAPAPELSLPRATPGDAASTHGTSPAPAGAASPTSGAAGTVTVTVDVVGAVARPGLVKVAAGTRVADALAAAGGAGPDADLDRLNLAAPLSDGERIYVPHVGEASIPLAVNGSGGPGAGASSGSPPGGAAPAAPVDLNQAGEQELESLPGVGPATAQAILDYRRQHGPFKSVDDLLNVRGIGPAKLAAMRARVRV